MSLRLALITGLGLLLAACTTARVDAPGLAAPAMGPISPMRTFVLQDGGRHPAVILVPGCEAPLFSARAAIYERYAVHLRDAGYAAVIVTYPGAERGDPACQRTAGRDIAVAITDAMRRLERLPEVDAGRVHLIGWSWGARGVIDLASGRAPKSIVSAMAVYPVCPPPRRWNSTIPLQLMTADKDSFAPADDCRAWANKADGPAPVMITRYTNVEHGFDVAEAGESRFASFLTEVPVFYDRSTEHQLWQDMLAFLELGRGKPAR